MDRCALLYEMHSSCQLPQGITIFLVLSRFVSLLVVHQVHDLVYLLSPQLDDSAGLAIDLSFDVFFSILITPIGLILVPVHRVHKQANFPIPFLAIEWFFLLAPRLAVYAFLWAMAAAYSGADMKAVMQEVRLQVIETVPVS